MCNPHVCLCIPGLRMNRYFKADNPNVSEQALKMYRDPKSRILIAFA